MRLHVALGAGIRVVAPGAADFVGLLEYHEATLTLLQQPDAHAESAEAGADDHDFERIREAGRRQIEW